MANNLMVDYCCERHACIGYQHVNQESQEIIAPLIRLLARHAIYPGEQRLRDEPNERPRKCSGCCFSRKEELTKTGLERAAGSESKSNAIGTLR